MTMEAKFDQTLSKIHEKVDKNICEVRLLFIAAGLS